MKNTIYIENSFDFYDLKVYDGFIGPNWPQILGLYCTWVVDSVHHLAFKKRKQCFRNCYQLQVSG
jgi:hypothetical protein